MFKGSYISLRAIPLTNTTHLGCQVDSNLYGEALASNALRKTNAKLKFRYQKSLHLIPAFRRPLWNVLIQPHLDFACSSLLSLSEKSLKIKLQKAQNKYIRFCQNLPQISHIDPSDFRKIKLRKLETELNTVLRIPFLSTRMELYRHI